MSNEVKDKFYDFLYRAPIKGVMNSEQICVVSTFLDQFEGMKLVKEGPAMRGQAEFLCDYCEHPMYVRGHIYHNLLTNKNDLICKSCFDKQCPEPAANPAERRYTFGCPECGTSASKDGVLCSDCAEPEPWKELLKWNAENHYSEPHGRKEVSLCDAAYPEIERRVSRMIAAAIKAERERVGRALRNVKDKTTAVDDSFTVVLRLWAEFEQEASK